MKPMLPTYKSDPPLGEPWSYEVKYDGFRGILTIGESHTELLSRNNKQLLPNFPEIQRYADSIRPMLDGYLPVKLDGELTWLVNPCKSDFMHLQWRGRLGNSEAIENASYDSPAIFLAFDLIEYKGQNLLNTAYSERKKLLKEFIRIPGMPESPDPSDSACIQYIPAFRDFHALMDMVILYDGEGIVAKHGASLWEAGRRTQEWIKVKNWRTVSCFITGLNTVNGYFSLGVYRGSDIISVGQVKNGLPSHERDILEQVIKSNAAGSDGASLFIHPSICVSVHFLHSYDESELREPKFHKILVEAQPSQCTWEAFIEGQFTFPENLKMTSPDKPIWNTDNGCTITKIEYLQYLRDISSWMLPGLYNKALTTIRYPHGLMSEERFYQKNAPEYTPSFVDTFKEGDISYILCNDIQSLLWLGNQLAIEFHAPFLSAGKNMPDEIVLDLDPPSSASFPLAVKAAAAIKGFLDSISISGVLKTSGNKGLQIHIPIPADTYSWSDTRLFTDFLADYLLNAFPDDFTIERMKKNRHGKLYLDFVQHGEGKTIIVPYSARGNSFAGAATPLYWEELENEIAIEDFTIRNAAKRVRSQGCPFRHYEEYRANQPFQEVISFLNKHKK
ncbi:bifunctional non-homologous end joining protein LigD [Bacillus sp. OV322]|uniref:DNA ligase D n=1 Tax=Bacillus sp. OV322 TaxID=1882764 RepID=UPI0008E91166|nr:DNA ligase D [Bacillus sp. OV322]SFC77536.1 bifunctional non-homologous end joining protein LigD [Bacillus sp. OV322]